MAVAAMLETIHEMIFFLWTAYGDSKDFTGSTFEIKMQGLGQGNWACLVGWCVISIMILQAHGAKGHGAQFLAPISHVKQSLLAILYVDHTDLLHLNMERNKLVQDVHVCDDLSLLRPDP